MKYQLSELEKIQAAELSKIDRKIKHLKHDLDDDSDSPASQHSPALNTVAGHSQFDEVRDVDCAYYRHCTLTNCLNCKKLK